jgi:hypothetical protein
MLLKPSRDIVRGSGASQTRQPPKQLHPLRLPQIFKLQTFFHSTLLLLPSMADATSSEVSVKLRELAVAIRSAGDPVSQSPTLIYVHIKLTASETR